MKRSRRVQHAGITPTKPEFWIVGLRYVGHDDPRTRIKRHGPYPTRRRAQATGYEKQLGHDVTDTLPRDLAAGRVGPLKAWFTENFEEDAENFVIVRVDPCGRKVYSSRGNKGRP